MPRIWTGMKKTYDFDMITHPIPPLYDKNSKILILGSFPSVKSREAGFFYGHPQNRFWKVLAAVFEEEVPLTIDEKKKFLLKNHIALWDVIQSCEIEGSSDSTIKNVQPNDLKVIFDNADIAGIFVNGKTSEKYYKKYIEPKLGVRAVCLPSTSPANAAWSIEKLTEAWRQVRMKSYEDDEQINTLNDKAAKDPLAWEEIRTEHIVQDEWIDFRRSAYRFPDGRVFEPFYTYSRRDYVVIVASDTEGRYLCVRQFRQGIKQVTTEFVAGGIERNDGKEYGNSQDVSSEEALPAAKRELLEETGYESDEWRHLLTVPSNATIADNYAHIFVARNCRRVSGQALDETEFLNVKTYSASEIEELIKNGGFQQAMHILAWVLTRGKVG